MAITITSSDLVMTALAVLCVVLLAGLSLAGLVKVLGRKLPEVERAAALWLLRDADGWEAREKRLAQSVGSRPQLVEAPAPVPGPEGAIDATLTEA